MRPKFLNLDSFLIGLNLDYFFKGSNECIDRIIFSLDDFVYLGNNYTQTITTNGTTWFGPVLNFTGLLSRNMDNVMPNCYLMYTNATSYVDKQF